MSHVRIGTPALYILLCLSRGERHGYEVMKEVRELSHGEIMLGPATLYTTIKRLLAAKLIEEAGERPDSESSSPEERRRYYRLTCTGQETVTHELEWLEQLVRVFRVRRA